MLYERNRENIYRCSVQFNRAEGQIFNRSHAWPAPFINTVIPTF